MIHRYGSYLTLAFITITTAVHAQKKLVDKQVVDDLSIRGTEMEYGKALLSDDKNDLYFVKSYDFTVKRGYLSQTIWEADWKGGKSLDEAKPVSGVNDYNNNGVVGMSRDGQRIYLLGTYAKKERMWPGLSVSTKKGEKWSNPKPLKVKGLNIRSQHFDFFVTPDETAIFITMATSEFGESNIYVSQKNAEGEWDKPVAIDVLNTDSTHEISPFYSEEYQTLYFASNRSGGQGDFDVYAAKKGGNWLDWQAPEAMPKPVNSEQFDAYFTVYKGEGSFFVSDRGDSLSKLYHLHDFDPEKPNEEVKEEAIAEAQKSVQGKFLYDGLPLEGVEIQLVDDNGDMLMKTLTDEEGLYNFEKLPADRDYRILYVDPDGNMDPRLANLDEIESEGADITMIDEPQDTEFDFDQFMVDYDGDLPSNAKAFLFDNEPNPVDSSNIEDDGSFKFGKMDRDKNYTMGFSDNLDESKMKVYNTSGDRKQEMPLNPDGSIKIKPLSLLSEEDVAMSNFPPPLPKAKPAKQPDPEPKKEAVKTPVPVKKPSGKPLLVIYFEFNQVVPDGGETAKMDTYILGNKRRNLRVIGHTDDVGSESINNELSQYRAEQVQVYLAKMGYDTSKLDTSWRGEKEPVAPNDSKANRAKNRRVEIYLAD